jgi:hypothetical protein
MKEPRGGPNSNNKGPSKLDRMSTPSFRVFSLVVVVSLIVINFFDCVFYIGLNVIESYINYDFLLRYVLISLT